MHSHRYFFPVLVAAELPEIRFHDLRHTYASLIIEQGENIVYISKQMGHSSPVVTSTIYAHLINDKNYESACGLEEMIFEKNGGVGKTTISSCLATKYTELNLKVLLDDMD